MNLYEILFDDSTSVEEYGSSESDIREFVRTCYPGKTVHTITEVQ